MENKPEIIKKWGACQHYITTLYTNILIDSEIIKKWGACQHYITTLYTNILIESEKIKIDLKKYK